MLQLRAGLHAHASGALWIESAGAVVIADAHLGHGWALRKRGHLVPLADSQSAAKLFETVEELGAKRVVFAGDVVHAPKPSAGERAFVERSLRDLAARAEVVVVRGNHDRAFARDFRSLGFEIAEQWACDDLLVLHGDRAPEAAPAGRTLVLGHLHPAAVGIDAAGVATKVRVFLVSERLIVLPAFSPFAGGVEVGEALPPEIERLRRGALSMLAATGRVVAPIGPLRPVFQL